jgi:ubiquinol-cytochrome c reductase cytochrome c1 subunit
VGTAGQQTAEVEGPTASTTSSWCRRPRRHHDAQEYDEAVADLVAYLQWMGEPAQIQRKQLGVWVLLFLGVFMFLAWRLNAAYWKDVK